MSSTATTSDPIFKPIRSAVALQHQGVLASEILAGAPPAEAVKYQILIMLLITAGVGFGTLGAAWVGACRLFDERERLRLDRLA